MKQYSKSQYLFIVLFSLSFLIVKAQEVENFWIKTSEFKKINEIKLVRKSLPEKYSLFDLDENKLDALLKKAPNRTSAKLQAGAVVNFPSSHGEMEKFRIMEASVMEKALQKKYPNIKSYVGKSLDNPGTTIRISMSPIGFHGMILKNSGEAIFIDPYTVGDKSYIVYNKKSLPEIEPFVCKFEEVNDLSQRNVQNKTNLSERTNNANDGNLRTFRIAIATTGEYSQFHLDYQGISATATDAEKKAAVLSAVNATLTRVTAIFERDVALSFELIANNTDIIFLDGATDPFTNDDGSVLIDESQSVIDSNIGLSNYDIGHTFSTGGGGLAQLYSPCTNNKARGITGSSSPIGDAYDIDFVAHELGHQFGAHHTFNGDALNCAGDNRNDGTAVEPGSGSTIMAYAGLCGGQNVQNFADSYFHLISIQEMWTTITSGNATCGAITATGNTAPTVNEVTDYTIPVSTPFVLDATGNDVDGDNLTYIWEQLDNEITTIPPVSTATGGAVFRSIAPSADSKRYFPNLNTVVSGDLANEWEVLPSVARTMRFGVTVRDNNLSGGQTASTETVLTVDAASGPFSVTSQATPENWNAGTTQTVTWDVANTNNAPINVSQVNILLSLDGGFTFPITLASNIPNNGSYEINVPNQTTISGRIKVESVGNVFYAMSAANINIQASEFVMDFTLTNQNICAPNNAVYNFTYNTFNGFNEVTTFSASGNPPGTTVTFNPTTASTDGTPVEVTVSGIAADDVGVNTITVTGTSASAVRNTALTLHVFDAVITTPVLATPENNSTNLLSPYNLSWNTDDNIQNYDIELASDVSFTGIVETGTVSSSTYTIVSSLAPNTTYYWRVKGRNDCPGESAFSTTFSFTTENVTCEADNSTDTPIAIPDNDTVTGANSAINITNNKTVTDINVTVNISHTWDEDLTLKLTSPSGTPVILSSANGGDGDNYTNTVFDDDAGQAVGSGVAPFTGTYRPETSLSTFNNEESYGEWTLTVTDSQAQDVGTIENWTIEICGIPVISNDDDKDGVVNANDLCPNTPLNSTVDATGCPIFSLPANNFSVEAVGETCVDKDNGQIIISAQENYNYSTTINGAMYNFTNSSNLVVENLAPGSYDFCITVDGEGYEQCYSLTIEPGVELGGKTSVVKNKLAVEISEGTAPYYVYINGVEVLQTTSKAFNLNVKHGDYVEVKTSTSCEGVLAKVVETLDAFVVYPNPTDGIFEIAIPNSQTEVMAEIYNVHSQLLERKVFAVKNGKIQLNLTGKPEGVYLVKLLVTVPVTLKIIKQ